MGLDICLALSAWPNWKLSLMFTGFAIADIAAALLI